MKTMNRSKLLAAAAVATAASAVSVPFADVFEALAAPLDPITRETIAANLPDSKATSPFVGSQ